MPICRHLKLLKWTTLFFKYLWRVSCEQGGLLFFSFAICIAPFKVAADASLQVGDPIAGKVTSAMERCQECHGEDGNSNDLRIPKHAGQNANYLIKQLRDFKSGARQHEVMSIMAADLTEAEMANIAAYFASQKTMQGFAEKDYPLAIQLFFQGDETRDIPPCQSCHGDKGKGKQVDGVSYPVIGGQNRNYLYTELVNWQLGERSNSPGEVMNKIAKQLNDDEIKALANYLSGL